MTIAQVAVSLRKRTRMTQAQFAKALGLKQRETVAQYEGGTLRPSLDVMERMARLSGLSIQDVLHVPSIDEKAEQEHQNQTARANLEVCLHSHHRDVVIQTLATFAGRRPEPKGPSKTK